MKLTIEYTLNGKKFNSLEDAVGAAVMEGYKNIVAGKLSAYADEINDSGGSVSIDFTDDNYNANVLFHKIPTDLADKLKQALSQ